MKKIGILLGLLLIVSIGFANSTVFPDIDKAFVIEQGHFDYVVVADTDNLMGYQATLEDYNVNCDSFTSVLIYATEVGFRHIFNAKILKWIFTNNI
jgi:hypothetical protein